ncbi:hypothetical protein I553_2161 [Mycobacterium xenopi 4042]|uniref:Uncharacterized protein n=1 Tax=Mycobacterium xenopi 4042 TaxID=1299334 RepID=X8DMM8_MYCXE|nr:hypothetical protein I553_2161 [Mycobacterium xenopi 4042]
MSDAEAFTARLVADGVPCQLQVYPVRCTFFICSLTCYPKRGLRSTSSLSLWRRPPDHTPRRSAVRESGWHRGL